jgi:hypothetical protein
MVSSMTSEGARTCSIASCDGPHVARGWCEKHYSRWKRHGDTATVLVSRIPKGAVCSVDGCTTPVLARGWCAKHYQRWLKHGDPLKGPDQWAENNPTWLGDEAGYQAFHGRVHRRRGMPSRCERCGTEDPTKRYEWANLTGHYEDPDDYERMCKHCHQLYDAKRRARKPIDHGTPAGWLGHQRRSEPPCDECRLAFNAYARQQYRLRKARTA